MTTVAVTIGDPAGIGPEVALKALNSRELRRVNILLIGHREPLQKAAKICGLKLKIPDFQEKSRRENQHARERFSLLNTSASP
jgi:4-hydroxythreonine-4-phosphate dehydrogenase